MPGGPQNPLQCFEVLVAQVGQIWFCIDLNRLGRFAVAAIEEGLRGRNAGRRRGFRVLHYDEQGIDRILRALARGSEDIAEYSSRLNGRWPLGPSCWIAALPGPETC
jgi:hypothetical protein